VRLVRFAALDQDAPLGVGSRVRRGRVVARREALEQLGDVPVLRNVVEVADDERAAALAGPAALAEGGTVT